MNACSKRILVAAGATLLGFGGAAPIQAGEITVVSWGGSYSASQRKAFHEPFMKETGHTLLEDEWNGDIAKVRAWVETENYLGHVIDAESGHLFAGCDEAIWEPIDYAKLGLSPDDFLPEAGHECGVGNISWSTVYAYRTDIFPDDPPGNWADFWNVEKFPGKRGVYKSPKFNLEFALIADGVPAAQVNETLNGEGGVDRAFAKLDELKAHIIWWESGSQAPQLLADKEVAMSTGWNGRFYSAIVDDGQPFQIVWDGQGMDYDYWVIPNGHPEVDLAYEFIAFASRPERMGDQTTYISYGPLRKGADQYVNPDILPHLPTAPQNTVNWFKSDTRFWADQREGLSERFNVWVAQ